MEKEIAGQPLWLWLVGAGIVVVGIWYFKSHSSSSSTQQQAPAPVNTPGFTEFLTQHQGQPNPKTKKQKGGSGGKG
jgi:hypothetical protein